MKRFTVSVALGTVGFAVLFLTHANSVSAQPAPTREPVPIESKEKLRQLKAVLEGGPIAAMEGFRADQFFQAERMLAVCSAISQDDHQLVSKLISTDEFDVNERGAKGFTLLYWAYCEDSLLTFQKLLDKGADPDARLVDIVKTQRIRPLFRNDTVLFTSLRHNKYYFFLAALKYTKRPDQLDGNGESMLHAFFEIGQPSRYKKFGLTAKFLLSQIIDSGVKLDARNRHGSVASHLAVQNLHPLLCLQLLEAGLDPSLENGRGQTVRESLRRVSDRLLKKYPDGEPQRKLQEWLDNHAKKVSELAP